MRLAPDPARHRDRAAAGRALAESVAELELVEPIVVTARGGVAVAAEVARALEAQLTAVDVERVNAGGVRVGGATANGPPYLREGHGVPESEVESALARARRSRGARGEARAPDAAGRRTNGSRRRRRLDHRADARGRVPVGPRGERAAADAATPVGHVDGLARIRAEADEIVCPHPLEVIAVVGQAYDIFDPLDEWYVAGLLADAG